MSAECEHPATEWKFNGGRGAHVCVVCHTIVREGPPDATRVIPLDETVRRTC